MLQGSNCTYCGLPGHKFDPLVAFQPPSTLLLHTSTGIQFVQLHVDLLGQSSTAASATATAAVEASSSARSRSAVHAGAASPSQAGLASPSQAEAMPSASTALPSEQHQAGSNVTQHHADGFIALQNAEVTEACPVANSTSCSSLEQDMSRAQEGCVSQPNSPQQPQPTACQQQLSHQATLQDCNQQQQSCVHSLLEQQHHCQPESCHQQSKLCADKATGQQQGQQSVDQLPCYYCDNSQQHAAQVCHASAGEAMQADCAQAAPQPGSVVDQHTAQDEVCAVDAQASRSVWSMSSSSSDSSAFDAMQQGDAVLSGSDAESNPFGTLPQDIQQTWVSTDFTCRLRPLSRKLPLAIVTLHSSGPCFSPEHFIVDVLPGGTLEHYAVSDYLLQVVLQSTASSLLQPSSMTNLGIMSDPVEAVIVIAAVLNARLPTSTPWPHKVAVITGIVPANAGNYHIHALQFCVMRLPSH